MFSWLPKSLKQRAKSRWKGVRVAISRKIRAFSKQDLLYMLQQLGIKSGDVLLVHSSFDHFSAFLGKPMEVVAALQEAVGPSGTLLMPTMPFTGSALEFVNENLVFHAKRTPSKMGLLTELFRRAPGVIRSVHPTHAVAAWGARADEIVRDHHKAHTPCGKGTPYGRLPEFEGKILLLGTGVGAMTFFHSVEEMLEPEMPFSPFTKEVFRLKSFTAQNELCFSETRLFDPYYSRRRNLDKLVPVLKARRWWREAQLGGVRAILLNAREVLEASRLLARQGVFCYD